MVGRRLGVRRLAVLLASIAALFELPSGVAASASATRIDMRLLLVSATGSEPAIEAWRSTLDREGVPYDDFVAVAEPALDESRLLDGPAHARYQAVILASRDLAYDAPGAGWTSALDPAEWEVLRSFERTFGIRQISAYTYPSPEVGLNYPHAAGSLDGLVAEVTAEGTPLFPDLAGEIPIQGAWGYLATPLDPGFVALVRAPTGEPLVGVHRHADGRQELVVTMDSATWALHSRLLLHGLLGWVTRHTYLGYSRDYFAVHVDDLFSSTARWEPHTNQSKNSDLIRMTAADLVAARDWSERHGFRLDFPYNAAGADPAGEGGTDGLTSAALQHHAAFGFINHTYTHDNLNVATQDKIVDEVRQNIDWARRHGVKIDARELITGAHSGLANPNMASALADAGIDWIASDNSASSAQYPIGPALTAPRYPTGIYYDTATRAEQLDQYNYRWHETCPFAWCLQEPATWEVMVERESDLMLTHILGNDPRTHFVHQANLAEERVLYPFLERTFEKYFRYRAAGFAQPTLAESGAIIRRTGAWLGAMPGVEAYLQDGHVHLSATDTVQVPVTGTPVGSVYAGERSGWMQVSPGDAVVLPALGADAANLPPVAQEALVTTAEDTAVAVTLVASDPDGDPLSFDVVAGPASGVLGGSPPHLTYTPNPDWAGVDALSFAASDGRNTSSPAVVTVTVTAVDDLPVADPKTVLGARPGRPAEVVLSAIDVDSADLDLVLTDLPASGDVALAPTSCVPDGHGTRCTSFATYTPAPAFSGRDAFAYAAAGVGGASAPAEVVVQVDNAAPRALATTVVTSEDVPVAVDLAGVDADGDALEALVVRPPLRGQLSGTGTARSYAPDQDYAGTDSFEFVVTDGAAVSEPAVAAIVVEAVDDAPVVDDKTAAGLRAGSVVQITLTGGDVDSAAVAFDIVDGPEHGSLGVVTLAACETSRGGAVCRAGVDYTADARYTGGDAFTYRASDGTSWGPPGTVRIEIVDAPPAIGDVFLTTLEDVPLPITLPATDGDGDALLYTVVDAPANGRLTGAVPGLVYEPAPDFHGPDSFTFEVTDGNGPPVGGRVTITVEPVDDAPVGSPTTVRAARDRVLDISLHGRDVDSHVLTFEIVEPPQHGSIVSLSVGACSLAGPGTSCAAVAGYAPSSSASSTDRFVYRVSDGAGAADAEVEVIFENRAPIADRADVSTDEDVAVAVTLPAHDPDGDRLTYSIVTHPAHGTLTGQPPELTFVPGADWSGTDEITYAVSDGSARSEAVVAIVVLPVNDDPVADPKAVTGAHQLRTDELVLSASDVDGNALEFSILAPPAHGTLSAPGRVSCTPVTRGVRCTSVVAYTPAAGFAGQDSFRYAAADAEGASSGAAVGIQVTNASPTALDSLVEAVAGATAVVNLRATDPDDDPLSFVVLDKPSAGVLSGTPPYLTWTAPADFAGTQRLTFRVSDGIASSGHATVTLRAAARRIAFESDRDGNPEIYTVNPDGSDVRRVTLNPAPDRDPAWSPDHKRLAFASSIRGQMEIVVADAGGRATTRLTSRTGTDDVQPAWSPDGAWIAFVSRDRSDQDEAQIVACSAGGLSCRNLTGDDDDVRSPTFSPDGRRIAYVRNGELWVMRSDGRDRRRLLGLGGAPIVDADWAPDGRRIVITVLSGGNLEVAVVAADGTLATRLTSHPGADSTPAFSPDGASVVFSSDRGGWLDLWSMTPNGSDVRRLTQGVPAEVSPDW